MPGAPKKRAALMSDPFLDIKYSYPNQLSSLVTRIGPATGMFASLDEVPKDLANTAHAALAELHVAAAAALYWHP